MWIYISCIKVLDSFCVWSRAESLELRELLPEPVPVWHEPWSNKPSASVALDFLSQEKY